MRFWKPRKPWGDDDYSVPEKERLRSLPTVIIDSTSGDISEGYTRTGIPFKRIENQKAAAEFVKGEVVVGRFNDKGIRETVKKKAFVFDTEDPDLIEMLSDMGYLRVDNDPRETPLEKKNILELKQIAKAKGIPGYGNMNKASLLEALNEPSETD